MATDTQAPRSGFIQSDGLQIYFERSGEGSPLVLVHGWGSDLASNWLETGWVDLLGEYRQVVSIDIRGHGRSDKPYVPELYSYAAMCSDVLAVMDSLKIDTADFMGYSMGAFMGAYLLGHHPERFASMVLGGIGDETEASAAQGAVIAAALRAPGSSAVETQAGLQVRAFAESNPNNDLESLACSALQMWPEGYPVALAGVDISRAGFPVLIVNGEKDHPYVDSADRFADVLPNGMHLTIPGTDHLTTVTDKRFKDAVVDFLNRP